MSHNQRMQKWLKQVEEGNSKNPSSPTPILDHIQQPNIIRQEIVYIPQVSLYVGFWSRVFAFFLDSLILSIFFYLFHTHLLIEILIGVFYYTYWPSTHMQGTFGKVAIGAKIVDVNGNRLTYVHSCGRFLAQLLSGSLFLIGYFMVAFHAKKRGMHDMMADTYVVNK
ncbi:RDD family protein [Paenibacillus sp. CMAA1364]